MALVAKAVIERHRCQGRIRRTELFGSFADARRHWWFVLFLALAGATASVFDRSYGTIFFIVTLLPLLAVGTRRLPDTGSSGWWQLIGLVPVAGIIVLIFLLAQKGKESAVNSDVATGENAAGAPLTKKSGSAQSRRPKIHAYLLGTRRGRFGWT